MKKKKNKEIIVGLDLGTSTFRALGVILDEEGLPRIVGAVEKPAGGLKKGIVTDMEECSLAVVNTLSELQRATKTEFKSVFVNINGEAVSLQTSRGITSVARADSEITYDDVLRALEGSKKINLPSNRTIIQALELEYFVDGIGGILDPIGMHGIRLEVESLIVDCFYPWLKNVTKCVEDLGGYKKEAVVYNPVLLGYSVLSKNQKDLGALVLDLGASTTNLLIFEDRKILMMKTLPIGGNNITNDLALALKIPVDKAEKIKIHFGSAKSSHISKKEKVNLSEVDDSLEGEVSRKYIAQIIEARLEDIFDSVYKELKSIEKFAKLPGGVVLVGGGAKMPLITDLAKDKLKLSSQVGLSANFSSEALWSDEERRVLEDPAWVVATGLVLWAIEQYEKGGKIKLDTLRRKGFVGFVKSKIKEFFNSFLPLF